MKPQVKKTSSRYLYRCAHCKKVVERDVDKRWIPSYCEETGRNVRLMRVINPPAAPGQTKT